jgi:Putative Actinobacterial Holin-X, holin superfamily III
LGTDTGTLIRAEAALAKAEARETAARVGRDAAKVAVAAGLALVGVLALTAFLILGLGTLLGGAWWLSALIVGAATLGIGGMLVGNAVRDLKSHSLAPQQTIETLKEDKDWAARQVRNVKQELSDPNPPSIRR